MTKDIYIVCGVPGAGKTWVCRQVASSFSYVPHDDHIDNTIGRAALLAALKAAARTATKPLLTECPFGERVLRDVLVNNGFTVFPVFVVEHLDVVKARYSPRGRELPKASATRVGTIEARAKDWNCPHGTSNEIADYLKLVGHSYLMQTAN